MYSVQYLSSTSGTPRSLDSEIKFDCALFEQ